MLVFFGFPVLGRFQAPVSRPTCLIYLQEESKLASYVCGNKCYTPQDSNALHIALLSCISGINARMSRNEVLQCAITGALYHPAKKLGPGVIIMAKKRVSGSTAIVSVM